MMFFEVRQEAEPLLLNKIGSCNPSWPTTSARLVSGKRRLNVRFWSNRINSDTIAPCSRRSAMAQLSAFAAEQWAMVTAAQARRLGVSRSDLNRRAADGTLEPVAGAARVYRLTGAPDDPNSIAPALRGCSSAGQGLGRSELPLPMP